MKKNIIKFCLVLTIFFLLPFFSVLAQEKKDPITFIPQVTIPKSSFQAGVSTTMSGSLSTLGDYVKSIYNYLILIVGLVAAIALMIAGIVWLTAGGNSARISSAKSWIGGSLTGLVLALSSYLILQTINPALVDFRDQNIDSIGEVKIGCCRLTTDIDTNGYLTGTVGRKLTRDLSSTQCYLRAQELKEPNLKTIKELKEDPEYKNMSSNDAIEKYLQKIKVYLPNYISSNFVGCAQVGVCYYFSTLSNINRKKYDGNFCFVTTENTCTEIQTLGSEVDRKYYIKFFSNNYSSCSNIFINDFVIPGLKQNSLYEPRTDEAKFISTFEEASTYRSLYKYNSIVYFGKGKLGEPCGDEKDNGICVPLGRDCKELKFVSRNWGYGGRSCGDGVKCCNQN